ncbi:MAG: hypothetical protein M5U34_37395 [Chloroflexi bacterium]|nr:hypothetical protein [Chloroflexota bacterium]
MQFWPWTEEKQGGQPKSRVATTKLTHSTPKLRQAHHFGNTYRFWPNGRFRTGFACLPLNSEVQSMSNFIYTKTIVLSLILLLFILSACAPSGEPAPPDCTSDGIAIMPTATRQTDPDLFSPRRRLTGETAQPTAPHRFRLRHQPGIFPNNSSPPKSSTSLWIAPIKI